MNAPLRPIAPPADAFAKVPMGWFNFAESRHVADGPVTRAMPWGEVVVWRHEGQLLAMDARCPHMGADLGGGHVEHGCVVCPFHGLKFNESKYATAEHDGRIWLQPTLEPTFSFPTFEAPVVSARPFTFDIAAPYWMVAGNGFDMAHFNCAHDRRLVEEPTIDTPHPLARCIRATFEVIGDDWRDRALRTIAGDTVRLEATVWAGSLALVRSRFRRSTTYGLVELRPTGTATRVTVWIHVRRQPIGRALAAIRANFVKAFLKPDVALLQGARYAPHTLTPADACLADFFRWLAPASHGDLR